MNEKNENTFLFSLFCARLWRFFRHQFSDIPCMDSQENIEGKEDAVRCGFSRELKKPDRDRDVDLEDHDPPPLSQVPVAETREEEV